MKPVHFYSCLSKALVAGLILTGALSTKVLAEEADPKWKEPYDTPVNDNDSARNWGGCISF